MLRIATADVSRVARIVEVVAGAVIAAAGLTVAAVVLLSASVQLGLVVLIGLPPVLALLNLLTGPLDRRSTAEQEQAARATAAAGDLVSGLRVLKGLCAETAATARYREASRASLAARLRATTLLAAHSGATLAVTSAFLALVALVGGRLAAQGQISIGELVAAVGLTQYLIGPLGAIAFTFAGFAQCRASARRVAALLAMPVAVTGGPIALPHPTPGALRLAGLSHGALREVDLEIASGELVGWWCLSLPSPPRCWTVWLARPNPRSAGSSSTGWCWRTSTSTTSGRVSWARRTTPTCSRTPCWRTSRSPQRYRIGSRSRSRRRPRTRSRPVCPTVPSSPSGPVLTERARSLSGGQRQRVALARALAADPAVLVLHDPTTAVDAVTEARIAARLRVARTGRTTVLVTTSPVLLAATDRVVVLLDGTVAALGTHAELVGSSERYREVVLK